MRKLFVVSCGISVLFVLGAFVYSRWHATSLSSLYDSDASPHVVENTIGADDNGLLDSYPIQPEDSTAFVVHEPIDLDLDNLDPDVFAAVGIDIEGLTEVEILKAVVAKLEENVRWGEDFLAEWEAYDRRTEAFKREQQEQKAEIARLKAKIESNAAEYAAIERYAEQFLPDSFHFDQDRYITLLDSGMPYDEIESIMIAETFGPHKAEMHAKLEKLMYTEPTREIRPGGLPPNEFDPHDPRRSRASD